MFEKIRALVLRLLRVPGEPHPPAGAPNSIRVFRAGRNFFTLRLLTWSFGQAVALATLVFWSVMVWKIPTRSARSDPAAAPTNAPAPVSSPAPSPAPSEARSEIPAPPVANSAKQKSTARPRRNSGERIAASIPPWLVPLLRGLELLGFVSYLLQLVVTYSLLRLDYELRWYVVTDRSLRIRSGLWRMQEITMSFANIQQVSVTRGPIQGWLKIADVRVRSAGGGGSEQSGRPVGPNLHEGIFHGLDNAQEVRDLMLERLRKFRATGLGDPDDHSETGASPAVSPVNPPADSDALAAAKELLQETRALRQALLS